jgi:hypothetical protein
MAEVNNSPVRNSPPTLVFQIAKDPTALDAASAAIVSARELHVRARFTFLEWYVLFINEQR